MTRSFTDKDSDRSGNENQPELDLVSIPAVGHGILNQSRANASFSSEFENGPVQASITASPDQPNTANEVYLLEQANIIGRKTELRQLLKLINLSRQGQPKAVLLAGDAGMGKTALMDSFLELVRQSVYSRVVDCRNERFKTPQHFYVSLIDHLRQDAHLMIQEALLAINDALSEIGLVWETQDLIRAVSLVQLQDSLELKQDGGKTDGARFDAISGGGLAASVNRASTEEQLMKAIKNSVPTVKKLRLSLNAQVEKLVKLILNPWVITACHLASPVDSKIKAAFALADEIKGLDRVYDLNYTRDWEAKRPQYFQTDDDGPETVVISKESGLTIINPRSQSKKKQALQGPLADMTVGLKYILNFINRTISSIDSSLLLAFDNWEAVADIPHAQRDELKQMVHDLLADCAEQKQFRLMFLVGSDTAKQSKSLGGPLFSQFRTKLLLSTLESNQARKFFKQPLNTTGIEVDESVHQKILGLTQGNPYWQRRAAMYVLERAQANKISHVDAEFFSRLCIEEPEDLLELAYTRIKLSFLQQETSLEKVVAALLKSFPHRPFQVVDAIREISLSQHLPENFVYDALQRLEQHFFLSALERQPNGKPQASRNFVERWLMLQSQIDRDFLQQKTVNVQADLPTDEKLHFLKKVIPLSIQAGELDRGKTQEVLALCHSLGNTDIVEYLEDLFVDSLRSDQPAVRVTALNNLALIDSEKSRQALFISMKDTDAMVREYAARNLAMLSNKSLDPEFHRHLLEVLQESLDDDHEAVRAQVYQTLGKYRWTHDLMTVFIKGLSDAEPNVRLCSVKFLAESEQDSPFILNSLLDAMDDAEPEVRKYACLGIQRHAGMEAIQALVTRLREDPEAGIRALAADSLSFMDDSSAFRALSDALMSPNEAEDVKLAVVRTLGKRLGRQSEDVLLRAIETAEDAGLDMPPALLWASVRSLGQVGGTERAVRVLHELQNHADNAIIQSAAKLSLKKIHKRMEELSQLERQLDYTSADVTTITATPASFEYDVELHEDDAAE